MRGFQPLLHGRLFELLGASTQLTICSKSPCSIAISSWPYLQDAIFSSPPLQLSRKVVRSRSEHSSQSAHTLHYVRTHPGTIAEWKLIAAKLARLCWDADRIESKQKRLKSPHVTFALVTHFVVLGHICAPTKVCPSDSFGGVGSHMCTNQGFLKWLISWCWVTYVHQPRFAQVTHLVVLGHICAPTKVCPSDSFRGVGSRMSHMCTNQGLPKWLFSLCWLTYVHQPRFAQVTHFMVLGHICAPTKVCPSDSFRGVGSRMSHMCTNQGLPKWLIS
jgi:hypothetical protein